MIFTFLEFLTIYKGIDEDSPGAAGRLYRTVRYCKSNNYRDISLAFTSLGELEVMLERYWNEYEDALDVMRSLMSEPPRLIDRNRGDTNITPIARFINGFCLWRCINAAGVKYSFITDFEGNEIMSSETIREGTMLRTFRSQYLKNKE